MGAQILEGLWLTGFMGAGKSSVAAALAERWACDFHDTDQIVATLAGRSIPEIFNAEGEAAFRRREAAAFLTLWSGAPALVALGGGTVTIPVVRETLQTGRAHVVWLRIPWASVLARVDGEARPLLARGEGAAHQLFRSRERVYQGLAEFTVDAEDEIEEVAAQVAKWAEARHYVG